jgi:hypothetical protein
MFSILQLKNIEGKIGLKNRPNHLLPTTKQNKTNPHTSLAKTSRHLKQKSRKRDIPSKWSLKASKKSQTDT